MFNRSILLVSAAVIAVILFYSFTLGTESSVMPVKDYPVIGPHSPLPAPDCFPPTNNPRNTDDPIGQTYEMGTTWYDIQHNATCGHQVHLDNLGYVHIAWMRGLEYGAINRHIYYQLLDPSGNLALPVGGVQVDQIPRAGFTDLELYPDDRAMPCFHQGQGGATNFHTALAFDYIPRAGAFAAVEPPWVLGMEVIWPKVARSRDNGFHIISTENPASGVAGDPQRHYYIRGEFNPTMFTINYPPQQQEVAWTMIIGGTAAASPVSDRVAVGWLKLCATDPLDTTQHDNDLVVCISNNGLTWNWSDTVNITNWIEPDPSLLPDTARANKDTFRCYCSIDLIFDYNDVLHTFFNTEGYWHYQGTITRGNSFIWHWDEVNRAFSLVANGWFHYPQISCGAWNKATTRPQAAIDSVTGDIYCMYQRYVQPYAMAPQGFPYQLGDTADFSAAGWPNGEIWVTKSTDGGLSWAEGANVTRTRSPHALPGQCQSELTPSIFRKVVNGCCHIFYVLDRDAGAVVQTEGTWTENEVIYQRLPVDSVASWPLLPPYPMHCDSSGMPGASHLTIELAPVNPPIVIPAGGGAFQFIAQVENQTPIQRQFDAWSEVRLPNGAIYGPLIMRTNLPISSGQTLIRTITQNVPSYAPAGYYAYIGKIGTYPNTVVDADSFQLVKMAGEGAPNHNLGWTVTGWEDENNPSLEIETDGYSMLTASPNPFNSSTVASFELRDASRIKLSVYDIQGREAARLAEGWYNAGIHRMEFDGTELSSGLYFIRLEAGEMVNMKKVVLLK